MKPITFDVPEDFLTICRIKGKDPADVFKKRADKYVVPYRNTNGKLRISIGFYKISKETQEICYILDRPILCGMQFIKIYVPSTDEILNVIPTLIIEEK